MRQGDCKLGDILGYIVRWKGEKREGKKRRREGRREEGKKEVNKERNVFQGVSMGQRSEASGSGHSPQALPLTIAELKIKPSGLEP